MIYASKVVQEPFQIPIQLFLHPFYYGDLKMALFLYQACNHYDL